MPRNQSIKVGSIESVQGDPDIIRLHELAIERAKLDLEILELKGRLLRRYQAGDSSEVITIYTVRPTRVRSYERNGYVAVRINR